MPCILSFARYTVPLSFLLLLRIVCQAQGGSLPHNGLQRTYELHTPPSYSPGDTTALIIAMHGGFGSASSMQDLSGLNEKSDDQGFLVVYPEGVANLIGIRSWNAGNCCGYAMNNNIDDVGFISVLIDTLLQNYSIDPKKIYATGMSNGAFMSYRLACELSQTIAAIAPVAGTMVTNECSPQRGVPVLHIHSYQDENVPVEGGHGNAVSDHYNPPVDSVLNVWAAYGDCTMAKDTVSAGATYTHIRWHQCSCGNQMELYITQDGGHSWPGGNGNILTDPPSTAIDANDLIWEFFQEHELECDTTLATGKRLPQQVPFKVFPNPSNGVITMDFSRNISYFSVAIFDRTGRKVLEYQNQKELDLLGIPAGLYFIRLNAGGHVFYKTIVINP